MTATTSHTKNSSSADAIGDKAVDDHIAAFSFFDSVQLVYGAHIEHSKQTQQSPIGVFDSGVGGLSILRHLQALMPHEYYIYLADTRHVPYGERSDSEIEALTHKAVDWLYAQGCKLVVVACNSASAHSLDSLRPYYGKRLPIVGLVPAIKPAALQTRSKQVAVLATKATLKGRLLADVIDQYATPLGVQVHKYFFAGLVPWVEAGLPDDHQGHDQLMQLVHTLAEKQVDHLVLGCTHYPFFKHKLDHYAPWLHILDSGVAIAKRTHFLLANANLLRSQTSHAQEKHAITLKKPSHLSVFSSGDARRDKAKIQRLF